MKHLLLYITFAFLCVSSFAQPPLKGEKGEDAPKREFSPQLFKKTLEDFVTKEADLTPQEAQKLFPLLHEMMEAQRKVRDQERKLFCSKNYKDLTENDYEKIVTKSLDANIENDKIEQTYYKKFHSVLTWKKVAAVRHALKKFQMEAIRRISPMRRQGKGPHGDMNDNRNKKGANE